MLKTTFKNWLTKIVVISTALFAVQTVMAAESPYTLMQQEQVLDKLEKM